MAITLDKILGAYKQRIPMVKTNSVTTVAGVPFTTIDRAGFPVAGVLNPSQTTNGVVPTDATAGYPRIEAPSGSNKLYLSRVGISANVAMSVELYDVIFQAGQTTIPTSGTTTVALSSIPSIADRIPYMEDGTTKDYQSLQIYVQMAVAGSNHAHSVSVDYLDQGGAAGNTGNITTQSMIVNRLIRLPLAAGDTGVSEITGYNVNGITSATGAVVVQLMRSLGVYRTQGGLSSLYGPDYTGLPQIFADSAILMVVIADSTSSGVPNVNLEIAHMDPAA
jgi:hypothetical protein